jgi:primosomal protein N' (replication factor Y)
VFIQTRLPGHHAVRSAGAHDYETFVRAELADRVRPAYPPTVYLANVVFSGTRETETAALAQTGTEWLERLLERTGLQSALTITGPAPCPVERIKSRWRWHTLLKAGRSRDLTRVARYFAARFPVPGRAGLRVIVDRDPAALL